MHREDTQSCFSHRSSFTVTYVRHTRAYFLILQRIAISLVTFYQTLENTNLISIIPKHYQNTFEKFLFTNINFSLTYLYYIIHLL